MRVHMQFSIQVVIITFNGVVSSCCCFFSCCFCVYCFFCLFLLFCFLCVLIVVVVVCLFFFAEARSARNCSKVRTARAAQSFVLVRPIKFLIIGVVIADPAVDANYTHLSYPLHQNTCMLTADTRFVPS